MLTTRTLTLVSVFLSLWAGFATAEPKIGTLTLREKWGERVLSYRYSQKDHLLRLDRPGKHAPAPPVNLINRETGECTIIRPLNSTWTTIPATSLTLREPAAHPEIPSHHPEVPSNAGIGAQPGPVGTPGRPPQVTNNLDEGNPPQIPGEQPALPEMPTPRLPDGAPLPEGIGPQAPQPGSTNSATPPLSPPAMPGVPGMPQLPGGGMPMMPPMPGEVESATLTKTPESKEIHGYRCQHYELTLPGEGRMTLWLSESTDLPPFYLLLHEPPSTRGRMEWLEQWPALLREKNLFPFLAILYAEQEEKEDPTTETQPREIARWEVTSISSTPVEDPENKLFKIPSHYHKIAPLTDAR